MIQRLLIFIIQASLIASCSTQEDKKPEQIQQNNPVVVPDRVQLSVQQVQNAGIETGLPSDREMYNTLKVSGILDVPPHNIVSIGVPLGGFLKKISLLPGTRVNKGEVLATLEDQQYIQLQQDYLTAKSKLKFIELDFGRQRSLNETKTVSDKVFQQALNDFESQKILVSSLSERLRLISIDPNALNENSISRTISVRSPITGYVTRVNANTGKYMSPADVICELVNPQDLHLSLTVFENDAAQLRPGQKVVCYANNDISRRYNGTIHLITPNIGSERTTEVHCDLDGDNRGLLPGTFMNAEIQLNSANAKVLPEEAIVKWNNKTYIFSEEEEHLYKMIPVETGNASKGYTQILSRLPETKIVIKNAYTLLMRLKNSSDEG